MEIGDRIKLRREELGMSQEELAKKVGYKSRSSINKIEIDGRGLPQKKIVVFAKALQTTPAFLMGWEEIDSSFSGKEASNETYNKFLTNIGKRNNKSDELLKIYDQLSPKNQQKTLSYSKNLLSVQKMDEELNAANARTDIEATEAMYQHDDDIMDDENF